jgi:hypothetical protein
MKLHAAMSGRSIHQIRPRAPDRDQVTADATTKGYLVGCEGVGRQESDNEYGHGQLALPITLDAQTVMIFPGLTHPT